MILQPLDLVICRIKNKRKDEQQPVSPSTTFDDQLTTINDAAVASKPVLGTANGNNDQNNLDNEELNYSVFLDEILDLDATITPTSKPQADYNTYYPSELLQLPEETIIDTIEYDYCNNTNDDHQEFLQGETLMIDANTTVDHQDQHDNQFSPISEDNQGGGPGGSPTLTENWEVGAEGTFDLDYFVEQLMKCEGDDLEQRSTANITMLSGPDLYTQNYLLC